jgi:ATP-binding cassette, subfamily B, multidrug efflux pump
MFPWLWSYVRRYRFLMVFGLVLAVGVSALNMVNPTVAGTIVDKVILGGQRDLLWKLIALMVGTTLLKSLVRYCYQMMFEHASQNVIRNIREELYDKVQGLDFAYFDKTKSGDVMTLMTGDLDAVRHFIAWVIYVSFENALILVFSITVLMSINWRFTLIMLSVTPFIAFFALRLARRVKPTHLRVRDQFSRLNSAVQENIAGNRVVKAFVREDYEIARFMAENEAYKQRNLDSTAVRVRYMPRIDAFTGLLPVILIVTGGLMIINGKLTLGELVTFNGLMWAFSNPLSQVGGLVNDFQRFSASADRLFELYKRTSRIVNPPEPAALGRAKGRVEFRHVSFSYGDGPILEDIDFVAESGMTVGILGPTGSGKSSLVKLICRYYDCTEGGVFLDGLDVRRLDLRDLRSNVGITMQDVFLFSDTVEGNIAFGRPDASFEEVKAAASLADADGFITEMPEGYDTVVGERGVGLSGGQRQRIALARLLLKNPPVMVLDDTTSSVDVETEERIRGSIARLSGAHTTFLVAHRVSSLARADLILVMGEGRIVDRGTHAELASREGYYREVWLHQSGREVADRVPSDADLVAAGTGKA